MATGLPATCFGSTALDCTVEVLEKWQGARAVELRMGRETPVQTALWMTEALIAEAVATLHQVSAEENCSESWVAEKLKDIRGPADHFIK